MHPPTSYNPYPQTAAPPQMINWTQGPPSHPCGTYNHHPCVGPGAYSTLHPGECPHACTHHRRHKYRRRRLGDWLGCWLRRLFCCGGRGGGEPRPWNPTRVRLAYLRQAKEMWRGSFSGRFLGETRAARLGSRLNLDALAKDTDNGILSAQSLESIELELLERSLRGRWSWRDTQPQLCCPSNGSNGHNASSSLPSPSVLANQPRR